MFQLYKPILIWKINTGFHGIAFTVALVAERDEGVCLEIVVK